MMIRARRLSLAFGLWLLAAALSLSDFGDWTNWPAGFLTGLSVWAFYGQGANEGV